MNVSKEEILRISSLADLKLADEEIDIYLNHLQEILDFAEVVNKADVDAVEESISSVSAKNVFRKDEVKEFEETNLLLENAKGMENGMFQIPNIIN